jgi:hypothetical protein
MTSLYVCEFVKRLDDLGDRGLFQRQGPRSPTAVEL